MSFENYFQKHPEKVLGEIVSSTDKFGNPITIVKASIEILDKIDVSPSLIPSARSGAIIVHSDSDKNIARSLQITDESHQLKVPKSKKKKTTGNIIPALPKTDYSLFSDKEAFSFLNPEIDLLDVEVWVYYCKNTGKPIHPYLVKISHPELMDQSWVNLRLESGHLCYDFESKSHVPRCVYYSGNVIEKRNLLRSMESSSEFYENIRQNQLTHLDKIVPTQLKLTGDLSERLVLDPRSKFCSTFQIETDSGTETILEAFKNYLRNEVSESDQLTDVRLHMVYGYYLTGDRMSNSYDKEEKEEIKQKSAIESRHFMSLFLENLPAPARNSIEHSWNLENNGFIDANYSQVPIMFNCNRNFKKGELSIRPEQRDGVAFQEINGTGVCGYDVGIGKTLTAILTIAQFIQSGRSKRPIIAVPKQTYAKWIGEIHGVYDDAGNLIDEGILPQYEINDLFNLSTKVSEKGISVSDNTITFITYEGLKKIGFSDEIDEIFKENLAMILNQNDLQMTNRQKALENDKLMNELSEGKYDSEVMMDELNFDFLTIDEAHNCNKLFMSVKGTTTSDGKREPSRFAFNNGGQSSLLAKKAFFLSQYVQHISGGLGNVNLLTATPFTNNPLNVYNIFALANFNRLKYYGIENVNTFFEKYVDVTYEKVINSKGEIEEREVIKGWKNKVALQKIMFSIINYKSAEESPYIKRPIKITLPLLSLKEGGESIPLPKSEQISTILQPTPRQRANIKSISLWLSEQLASSEGSKKAPHLVADMMSAKNTLSPHIYEGISPNEIDPTEFINESPKLKATMLVIDGINQYHKANNQSRSCQIIYMNGGITYMPLIKGYLLSELGYKRNVYKDGKDAYDEVEILAGDIDDERKETVKNLFNSGIVKIIIGSSTIREGIDLQKQTTTLHNLWIDWNPTDYKQLEGRIWRFGNLWDYVRIISYLLTGGSDAFKFQKLEEKTARINDIFDRKDKSNILDVSDEDREGVKWALIDDVNVIAKEQIKDAVKLKDKEIKRKMAFYEEIERIPYLIENENKGQTSISEIIFKLKEISPDKFPLQIPFPEQISLVNKNKAFFKNLFETDYSLRSNYYSTYSSLFVTYYNGWDYLVSEWRKASRQLKNLNERFQKDQGITIFDINIDQEKQSIQSSIDIIKGEKQELESEPYLDKLVHELTESKKQNESVSSTPEIVANAVLSLNDKCLNNQTIIAELKKPIDHESLGTGTTLDKVEFPLPELKPKRKPRTPKVMKPNVVSDHDNISNAIGSLKTALEFADEEDKKSLETAINSLQTALEFI